MNVRILESSILKVQSYRMIYSRGNCWGLIFKTFLGKIKNYSEHFVKRKAFYSYGTIINDKDRLYRYIIDEYRAKYNFKFFMAFY